MKNNFPKSMEHSRSSSKREIHSNTISPQERRKISNKQSNPTLKTTRGRRTNKTQSQSKERNHKDQSRNKWNRNKENNSKDQQH